MQAEREPSWGDLVRVWVKACNHRHGGKQTHRDRAQANILYITTRYVCNKFSPRTMKFSKASQDDTAREINSLEPDKKVAGIL